MESTVYRVQRTLPKPIVTYLVTAHALKKRVLNWIARIARAAHTDGVSDKNPESLSKMQEGDLLVSHPTAVREHEISVLPNAPHAMSPTHDEAVSDARVRSRRLGRRCVADRGPHARREDRLQSRTGQVTGSEEGDRGDLLVMH